MTEAAHLLHPARPCDLLMVGRLTRLVQIARRINPALVGCAVELSTWTGLNLGPVESWPGASALRQVVNLEPEFWASYFRGLRQGYFDHMVKPGMTDRKRAVGWVTANLAAAHAVGIETGPCPWADYTGDLARVRGLFRTLYETL